MIKVKNSVKDGVHPYMRVENWINGDLCFWRKSPHLYTQKGIDYLEEWVKKMKKEQSHKLK